jgi:hypothetical protein
MTNETTENTQNAQASPELVEINTIDQFARYVAAWHQNRVEQLEHMLTIPDGAVFTVGDGEDTEQVVLEGDVKAGFVFGIELALMQIRDLPFVAEIEEVPATDKPN